MSPERRLVASSPGRRFSLCPLFCARLSGAGRRATLRLWMTAASASISSRPSGIAEAKAHIARQKEMIAKLECGGHETDLAVSTLRALELSLRGFELHRDLILDRLNDPP
jgi:hypothetical protein